jgi:hypothetical protein
MLVYTLVHKGHTPGMKSGDAWASPALYYAGPTPQIYLVPSRNIGQRAESEVCYGMNQSSLE